MNKKTSTGLILLLIAGLIATFVLPAVKGHYADKRSLAEAEFDNTLKSYFKTYSLGDWDNLMMFYNNSDSLVSIHSEKTSYGWENIYNNYKEFFSEKNQNITLQSLDKINSDGYGYSYFIHGVWMNNNSNPPDSGAFTILFRNFENVGWKITAEHFWQ